MSNCSCCDLSCVLTWRNDSHIPKDFATFLRTHGIVKDEVCPLHGKTGTPHKTNSLLSVCWSRVGKGSCRKRFSKLWPYFSAKQKNASSKFLFLVKSSESKTRSLPPQCSINKNTVVKWKKEILQVVAGYVKDRNEKTTFLKCAVDETYIFKRKYNYGRRARQKPFWMATVTGISRDGKCISTIRKQINNKKKETLQGIVKKHTVKSKKSLVMTDCLKAYKGLSDYLNHKTVNYSRKGRHRFVTEDGIHTNNAESCHSAIKRAIRRQGRLSMLPEEAEKTISLYTLWV